MEKWDGYNQKGESTGEVLIRGEEIPIGSYHIVVEILVVHTDGSILVMQRDHDKEVYPGQYEASAGGSVLMGESSLEGARRELKEETGIVANVKWIGDFVDEEHQAIFHQYISVTHTPKDAITLQKGETIGYQWLPPKEFFDFIEQDVFVDRQRDRILNSKEVFIQQMEEMYDCFKLSVQDIEWVMAMNHSFRQGFISRQQAIDFLSQDKNWIYAALRQGQIIGFAYGYELPRLDAKGNMLYIHEVAVVEQLQKKGIGYTLMNRLKEACSAKGICRYFLITGHENVGANKLYQKCGGEVSPDSHGQDIVYHFHTL